VEDGSKAIWPTLFELYYQADLGIPEQDIKDRLLFRQVIESLKCLESNVLRSADDGNIGSIMGIGAPVWTGGFIQFVNTYGELADKYGERFTAPAIAAEHAASGEWIK
jgi:3-hydroxyacyl-CoA dehydrogenase/enoyl-CoA hydratase/3-hydroxybutyryl-CoA epimerase